MKLLRGEYDQGDLVIVDHDEEQGLVFRLSGKDRAVEIVEEVSAEG